MILRPKVRLLVRKMLRASCWVMVEPPCAPAAALDTRTLTERAMPIGSTPIWLRKRRSSTAIIAARIVRRDLVVGQPVAEARPERDEHGAVGGADADHLAEVGALGQCSIARAGMRTATATATMTGQDADQRQDRSALSARSRMAVRDEVGLTRAIWVQRIESREGIDKHLLGQGDSNSGG